tara:strand:- start:11659 stop:12438 length:780 start_codon:yes stop_codon:yes gene_type:complete
MSKVNLDKLRQKLESLENKGKGGGGDFINNFLQLEDGDNLIRLLPGAEGKEFYAETKIHRVPDGEGGVKNFHCRRTHDEKCPLCEAYYGLWKKYNASGKQHEELADAAKQIKPRERYYMNAVERASGNVKILSVGQIIFKKVLKVMFQSDPDTGELEYGDITDIQEGHDYIINKVMEDGWPKYGDSMVRPKQTPAGKPKDIETYMDTLHDIHALVKLEDYEEVKNAALTVFPQLEVGRPVASSDNEGPTGKSFEESLET